MEQLKIKSYAHIVYEILIEFAVFLFPIAYIIGIIIVSSSERETYIFNDYILPLIILFSIALVLVVFACLVRFGSRTYDIYTKKSFVRVRKKFGKCITIYDISWEQVESIRFYGNKLSDHLLFRANMIMLKLKPECDFKPDDGILSNDYVGELFVVMPRKYHEKLKSLVLSNVEFVYF